MKSNAAKFLGALLIALLLSSYMYRDSFKIGASPSPGVDISEELPENVSRDQVLVQLLLASLGEQHFQPQKFNDEFSSKVYDLYLERLDFSKRFLHQEDVDRLSAYSGKIDDAIKNYEFDFFNLSEELINKRIQESRVVYQEILDKPFDFNVEEEINLDPEEMGFAKNSDEIRERWRKSLKYQTLDRLVTSIERQEKAKEEDVEEGEEPEAEKTFEEMEEDARGKVRKNLDNYFNRLEKLDHEDRMSAYINCIMNAYGPHTGYFPPKDKENFDISMSGRLEGIGARLQEKDGYIKVSSIVPGSASYRQGDLKAGDLILMVGQGEEDPVDIVDMKLDDAVKLIRGKKGTEVRLTVKKPDGKTDVVPIVRDIVIIEETYAKSAVVENETGMKVGYIKLPKFYADFQRWNGRRCSKDVLTEIEKLKTQQVKGIVLDLRNNGGGSLSDAVDMAGYFVEKGPVVQVKSRSGAPQVLADRDSRVQYDGPLVILVNQFSASASEILAAAIQDYNRGVIIGTSSSFGKGTVQRFFALDRALTSDYDHLKPLGEVKITTQKFYRINGGATQLRGVTPDIVLPDPYSYLETGEKEQDYVMEWDEIPAVSYSTWKPSWDLNKVKKGSEKRVAKDETFRLIEENAKRLKVESDNSMSSLNLTAYRAEQDRLEKEGEEYKSLEKVVPGLAGMALEVDLQLIAGDSVKTKINDDWLKSISKDHYINEAINVIADMN